MKEDLTIECKRVTQIEPWSSNRLDVELEGVDIDSVIESIGEEKLLNYIGENKLIEHLEDRGFKVIDEQ